MMCQAESGKQNYALYGEPGIGNGSSSQLRVWCPVTTNGVTGTLNSMHAWIIDSSSTAYNRCYAFNCTDYGACVWTGWKYACSTANGCNDPTTTYTGNAYIGFFNVGGNSSTVYQGLSCELAPGSWVSGVDAFKS
jgi:hypothetical protein